MDNKKLVIKDIEGNEYIFISQQCESSSFTYNESTSTGDGILKITYDYLEKNEEFYNFFKSIKSKEIVEINFFFLKPEEEEENKGPEYIELFSNTSKKLFNIKNILYNENFGQILNIMSAGLTATFGEV